MNDKELIEEALRFEKRLYAFGNDKEIIQRLVERVEELQSETKSVAWEPKNLSSIMSKLTIARIFLAIVALGLVILGVLIPAIGVPMLQRHFYLYPSIALGAYWALAVLLEDRGN